MLSDFLKRVANISKTQFRNHLNAGAIKKYQFIDKDIGWEYESISKDIEIEDGFSEFRIGKCFYNILFNKNKTIFRKLYTHYIGCRIRAFIYEKFLKKRNR
jgi:hypothetical protein